MTNLSYILLLDLLKRIICVLLQLLRSIGKYPSDATHSFFTEIFPTPFKISRNGEKLKHQLRYRWVYLESTLCRRKRVPIKVKYGCVELVLE